MMQEIYPINIAQSTNYEDIQPKMRMNNKKEKLHFHLNLWNESDSKNESFSLYFLYYNSIYIVVSAKRATCCIYLLNVRKIYGHQY